MRPDTQSNWRGLPAGQELDALIAERVFGYRWYLHGKLGKLGLLLPADHGDNWPTATPTDSRPSVLWPDYNTHAERKLGPLSTTWAGAGLVVEAMERRGWRLDLSRHTDWEAALWPRVGPPPPRWSTPTPPRSPYAERHWRRWRLRRRNETRHFRLV